MCIHPLHPHYPSAPSSASTPLLRLFRVSLPPAQSRPCLADELPPPLQASSSHLPPAPLSLFPSIRLSCACVLPCECVSVCARARACVRLRVCASLSSPCLSLGPFPSPPLPIHPRSTLRTSRLQYIPTYTWTPHPMPTNNIRTDWPTSLSLSLSLSPLLS